jgi:para-aminobenzoate synthetase component 1
MQKGSPNLSLPHPVVREIDDGPSAEQVFSRIAHLPYAVWLDSASHDPETGRYSFVACQPFAVLRSLRGQAEWETTTGVHRATKSVLQELDEALERWRVDAVSVPVPFCGGCAGFFGYELASEFETIPRIDVHDHDLPDLELAFYDVVIGWDHETDRCFVISTGRPETGESGRQRVRDRLNETLGWMEDGAPANLFGPSSRSALTIPPDSDATADRQIPGQEWLSSTMTASEYATAVETVIDNIRHGEVYQVNLSQRFSTPCEAGTLELYRDLRRQSPAPFGAVFRASGASILSSSPERFLRVDRARGIETRPIKGTRPRGEDTGTDQALASELVSSDKDRAENLMIVDLLRNDLSKVCLPGSVRVPGLFQLESWATVHHLVSIVTGQLRPEVTAGEVVQATFPSGSVTGAPKIRAMEIIADLECVARGPYCGAIGYIAFDGQMDLSVAIRILMLSEGRATYHAGGGVVYDSDPEDEYRETLAKSRALTAVVGRYSRKAQAEE